MAKQKHPLWANTEFIITLFLIVVGVVAAVIFKH
jgi:hypothetical protein